MPLITLKKNREFQFVYRKGKSANTKLMALIYVKSRYGGVRAGFSVSKKVGNSVIRNKARRRLKEALREILPALSGNYSIIFVARPDIASARYEQIGKEMRFLLKKAGILNAVKQGQDAL